MQHNLIGQDLEQEEQYLISLAAAGTNKWCYLNVNGADTADILSWDYRVLWQARKTFSILSNQTPPKPTQFAIDWKGRDDLGEKASLKRSLTKNGVLSLYALEGISRWLFSRRIIQSLPGWSGHLFIKMFFF